MSRKSPKRHHFFLNWLKANRTRFPFTPQKIVCKNRKVDFVFQGITPFLRFQIAPGSSGLPLIFVYVQWEGAEWDGLVFIRGGEVKIKNGWTCESNTQSNQRFWTTLKELWIDNCFEVLLHWCNEKLTDNSWIELVKINGLEQAKIHVEPNPNRTLAIAYKELLKNPEITNQVIIPCVKDKTSISDSPSR